MFTLWILNYHLYDLRGVRLMSMCGGEGKEIVHLGRSKTYKILVYFTFVHFAGGRSNKTHRNMDISKNVKKWTRTNVRWYFIWHRLFGWWIDNVSILKRFVKVEYKRKKLSWCEKQWSSGLVKKGTAAEICGLEKM